MCFQQIDLRSGVISNINMLEQVFYSVKATGPCSSFLVFKDCDQYGEIRFLCFQVRMKLKTTIDMDILLKCKASIINIFCVKATQPISHAHHFWFSKIAVNMRKFNISCFQGHIEELKTTIDINNILFMCKAFIFLPRDAVPLSVEVTHRSVVCLSSLLFVQRVK